MSSNTPMIMEIILIPAILTILPKIARNKIFHIEIGSIDKESFRQQHYEEGYFDYERDGFGEILYDENDVIDELDRILENGCVLDDKYRKRIDKFFTLRDENNSQRNFEAIKEICDRG